MNNARLKLTLFLVGLLMLITVSCSRGSTGDQAHIEKVVHDYIMKNPELLIQSLQGYQQKQIDEAQKSIQKTQQVASKFANEIFNTSGDPIAGNPKGALTIVEFFDYQCPHCSEALPDIEKLIKENPDLRVIYKDFPIRGQISETAAKASLAAHKQGKYLQFHDALLKQNPSTLTEAEIFKAATTAGLNVETLKQDMKNPDIIKRVQDNMKLGAQLHLFGTPSFFIAKSDVKANAPTDTVIFVPGRVELTQWNSVIKKIRQ